MSEEQIGEINPVFLEMIQSDQPVLVQFHAVWCGPCQVIAPIIDAVSAEFETQLKVLKVDIDKNRPITHHLGISSVPTLMIFQKGEILWHHAGGLSPVELKKVILSVV